MTSKYLISGMLVLCLAGCSMSGPGRLYSNVTLPFSKDFNNTPKGSKQCILTDHRIKEPASGYGMTVEWSTNQIQAAAREAGIENVYYMDIHTISYVLGIYTRRELIIYGD